MKGNQASGELRARWYTNGRPCRLVWKNGRVTEFSPVRATLPEYPLLAPALLDLQINGYGGVDFQQDLLAVEHLRQAAACLRRDGCARFFLTLITDEWPRLLARLRHLRRLRQQCPALRAAIAGWHIEGPFLSPEPGFCGTHETACMLDPTPRHIRQLRQAAGPDPLLLTLAPERRGAREAIQLAVRLGMTVSLGHTNASAEVLREAWAAGATGFTHLGNGCPCQLDRFDNILWRVLDFPPLTVSLIPDSHHVSPALFRLVHRLLAPPPPAQFPRRSPGAWRSPAMAERLFYTTDAMAAAGAPPGTYRLGPRRLAVGPDGIVRLPGSAQFAGSALSPVEGVRRAASMLGTPWPECWRRLSEVPAHFVGLDINLQPGRPATFCLVPAPAPDGRLTPQLYWAGVPWEQ